MLGAWDAGASAKPLQVIPATTRIDGTPKLLRHPGGNFGTTPQASIRRGALKEVIQLVLLLDGEQGPRSRQRPPMVKQSG
jgi:hypothetical protein